MAKEDPQKLKAKSVILTLDPEFFNKIDRKRKKLFYESVQQYVYALLRRDIFRKKVGGRPNEIVKAANVLTMKNPFSTKAKPFKI